MCTGVPRINVSSVLLVDEPGTDNGVQLVDGLVTDNAVLLVDGPATDNGTLLVDGPTTVTVLPVDEIGIFVVDSSQYSARMQTQVEKLVPRIPP